MTTNSQIRRARPEDARGIHDAHMLSIQTICSKDHTPEEIKAWGGRPFNEQQRIEAIKNHFVWVVEIEEKIEGYAFIRLYEKEGRKLGYVYGLYLTPKALGQNFGRKLMDCMLDEAKKYGAEKINLESTLTAHTFYQRMGFKGYSPMISINMNGTQLRVIPMTLDLNQEPQSQMDI